MTNYINRKANKKVHMISKNIIFEKTQPTFNDESPIFPGDLFRNKKKKVMNKRYKRVYPFIFIYLYLYLYLYFYILLKTSLHARMYIFFD
jgi:hypothetical protein